MGIFGAISIKTPSEAKNKIWFTAIDCSAYFPFKNATNKDLWTLNKKFKQKKNMLIANSFLTKIEEWTGIFKKVFKSMKKINTKKKTNKNRAM